MADVKRGIQSIETGFGLVACLEAADGPLALKELAARSGMSPSKAHNYLVSLVRTGLIEQVGPYGHYDLGERALQLGIAALGRVDLLEQARAALHRLRDATGATSFLALWGNKGPTIVNWLEGHDTVTVFLRAGSVLPLTASSTGRVFLCYLPEELTAPHLGNEWAAPGEVARMRRGVAEAGIATIDGTLIPGVAAVSAPVFDHDRRLRAVITLMGRSGLFDPSPGGAMAHELLAVTGALSRRMGQPEGAGSRA